MVYVDLLVRGVPDVPTGTAIVDGVGPEAATVMVGEVARMKDLGGTHSFSVEARASGTQRSVDFTILVWKDE